MNTKTNVLFAVSSLCNAGAETQALDLISGLDVEKFNRSLVIFKNREEQIDRLDGVNIKLFRLFRKFKLDASVIFRLRKIIRNENIQVVHCTNQFCMLLVWLACLFIRQKPRLVVALHTTVNVSKKDELLDRYIYRKVLTTCDKIIFVCNSQKEYWEEKYNEISTKSCVVYNGVDEQYYSRANVSLTKGELALALGLGPIDVDQHFFVSCIAGFRVEKAHDNLIQAFEKLPGNTILLLAGEGVTRNGIELLVQKMGLQERVHFLGNLNDVRPLLVLTDVTVLASIAVETFSIAMLESMAMEVPMVATDIGGLKEAIIPGSTGDLVPPDNIEALADSLRLLMLEKEKVAQMGRAARSMIETKFTKSGMIEATEQLLLIE